MVIGQQYKEITKLDFNGKISNFYRDVEVTYNPYSKKIALWDIKNGGFSPLYEAGFLNEELSNDQVYYKPLND